METSTRSSPEKTALPLTLLAAVIQGWALYGLHHAVKFDHWPATDQAALIPLYALAVFIPVTVELLAAYARFSILWRFIGVLSAAFFYFGWHVGAHISGGPSDYPRLDGYFPQALLFGIIWLLVLPFVQTRLTTGRWASDYRSLFTHAWHNKLMLAEAALFTGLFWLLLFLWQMLFHLLKIDYFRELFQEPIFIYPVTALTFGCAMHLIGSITQLTSVVLEQLLNVLKWLATLASVILALFTAALLLNLPNLVFSGQKAIGATWLLWLLAVMVLLLNAAYRDGSVSVPYPKWISQGLRAVVPLTVIIALTALYALIVRSRDYGLTVERVWAFVVAGVALLYAVGYTIAAVRKGAWLAGLGSVNVAAAVALIMVISAAMTPVLSPHRLAANSQFHRVQEKGLAAIEAHENKRRNPVALEQSSPLHYLRFDAGQYGRIKLRDLADSYSGADADEIRRLAATMLTKKNPWEAEAQLQIPDLLGRLPVFPSGRTLDPKLTEVLIADLRRPGSYLNFQGVAGEGAAGLYIDLNNDGIDEFVLLTPFRGRAYANRLGSWVYLGDVSLMSTDPGNLAFPGPARDLIDQLSKGNLSAKPSKWSDLIVGAHKYRLNAQD
jgi:Domain of unknown function (DUF4153)